jgi:ABC-type nitrate/sulfonate/bicarbonate transport system permease component
MSSLLIVGILIPILFIAFLWFNIKGLRTMWRDHKRTGSIVALGFFIVGVIGIFTGVWTTLVVIIYYLLRPARG